jgi:hypothetical protein
MDINILDGNTTLDSSIKEYYFNRTIKISKNTFKSNAVSKWGGAIFIEFKAAPFNMIGLFKDFFFN